MVEFLTPLGWIVACAALLPVAAAVVRDRRERRVGHALGLLRPSRRTRFAGAIAAAIAVLLLAAATARPALRKSGVAQLRTDAQAYFLIDISRSMLARRGPHGETRFARALAAAETIRSGLGDIRAGVASLTDRPLPHLFPTGNPSVFSAVLHRALGIERPPPGGGPGLWRAVQTNLASIAEFSGAAYFDRQLRHRLVILFSDGESESYSPAGLATQLDAEHIHLLVVRFWNAAELVYSGGRPERYRPDPRALPLLRQVAARTSGKPVFGETDTRGVVRAARSLLGHGPTVSVGRPKRLELAPYAALAALLPIAFVLRRRDA
jgi:von Willebrand factor type A domain